MSRGENIEGKIFVWFDSLADFIRYMGDRWLSSNLMASTYIWLPLTLSGTTATLVWLPLSHAHSNSHSPPFKFLEPELPLFLAKNNLTPIDRRRKLDPLRTAALDTIPCKNHPRSRIPL
jgi:hypothetical protein